MTFEVGSDGDKAQTDVNNRVQIANPRLPVEVQRQGVTVLKRSNDILFAVMLYSESDQNPVDVLTISNYVTINMLDEIKRVPGVGDAINFIARDYSMRIWLNTERMAQLGVTPADVQAAVTAQNNQYAAGRIGAEPAPADQKLTYTVTTKGRLLTAEQFGDIVLRSSGPGGTLRVKDVARVELGAQTYDASSYVHDRIGVPIGVFLQAGANALDTANRVRARLEELKPGFPPGVVYSIPFDTTLFIKASITEVVHTFAIAAVLVIAVVFVFLQTWRATLIPAVAVPVSLIGTFAGLYLFGFSINTLTLFAMVLAIGIVVDDAIVVLENVERLMREERLTPVAAAIEAMREVQGAVVAIVLVLCAVFIPVAFLGGIAGQLYKQFAVTVAVAVVLSGVVALTLTPALCAILLKHEEHEKEKPRFFRWFNTGFDRASRLYLMFVGRGLRHRPIAVAIFVLVVVVVGFLFWRTPSSFVPAEDQGYIIGSAQLPDGASLKRTERTTTKLRELLQGQEAIDDILTINGFDFIAGGNKTNAATIFYPLKDYDQRKTTAQQLVGIVFGQNAKIDDGIVLAFNPPAIRGIGNAGGYEVYRAGPDQQRESVGPREGDERLHRRAAEGSAARRAEHVLPQHGAAVAGRRRPREGARARRPDRRRVHRAAGHDGLAVRQRLQRVGPDVPRAAAGRRAVPHPSRRHRQGLRPLDDRRPAGGAGAEPGRHHEQHDPAVGDRFGEDGDRRGAARALQRLPRGPHLRRRQARRRVGRRDHARSRRSPRRRCRRDTRSTGPDRRSRRSGPATRRSSRSASRSSWCT